jgi:hypothetical protein
MKKNDMARLVLGMALLGSSLAGHGMKKTEGPKKVSSQKSGIFKEGELPVSKKVFKECLDKFLDDQIKYYIVSGKSTMIFCDEILMDCFEDVFNVKTGHNRFEKNPENIKESLRKDYEKVLAWLKEHEQDWVEKFTCFCKNFNVKEEEYLSKTSQDLFLLFKESPPVFEAFLNFLSQEKYCDQELQSNLENMQGPKIGIFQEKDKNKCSAKITKIILSSLYLEDKKDDPTVQCKFYRRSDCSKQDASYCMVYLDFKDKIGEVHYYNAEDGSVITKDTNTFVMGFQRDSKLGVFLKNAYPWLGREIFKSKPDFFPQQPLENFFLEARKMGDRMCERFFWKE